MTHASDERNLDGTSGPRGKWRVVGIGVSGAIAAKQVRYRGGGQAMAAPAQELSSIETVGRGCH
jgi:hypothetical protein